MAMESRDPKAIETAEQLEREYSDRLGGFCYALHPLFDGEVMPTKPSTSTSKPYTRCLTARCDAPANRQRNTRNNAQSPNQRP